MKTDLLVIDAYSLIYRAFYALPPLANSDGIVTNAVYGFINMLLKVIEERKPSSIIVAFDSPEKTFRAEIDENYKAHRPPMPDDLIYQIPIVKEILSAMNIAMIAVPRYEADDIIGTVVKSAEKNGENAIIVTGDRDALQLVTDLTHVLLTKKGISETVEMTPDKVSVLYGITPAQVPCVKALMGDKSDNIPGVPSIGEKGATKLINEYGTLENLIEHADELKGALGEKFRANIDLAKLSKELATIKTDVPMESASDNFKAQPWDTGKLREICQRYNFRALLSKIDGEKKEKGKFTPTEIETMELTVGQVNLNDLTPAKILNDESGFAEFTKTLSRASSDVTLIPNIVGDKFYGLCVSVADNNYYIELIKKGPKQASLFDDFGDDNAFDPMNFIKELSEHLQRGHKIIGHNVKDTLLKLYEVKELEYEVGFDAQIASYVIDTTKNQDLQNIAYRHYNIEIGDLSVAIDENGNIDTLMVSKYLSVTNALKETLSVDMKRYEVETLYTDIELPLIAILAQMEWSGVKIDVELLRELSQEMAHELKGLEQEIYAQAGEEFVINSPKQLQVILFEKLELASGRKTKTGYSTDAQTLQTLIDEHPIIEMLIRYRELTKLKSTYIDALPKLISERDGRVHTHFNQAITATGRLSSSEPNLQNIPVRTEESRRIKQAFIAKSNDYALLSADYSQIELRILADITEDENLTNIFVNKEDLHTSTASLLFNVPPTEVSREMRRTAKIINFSIPYGTSSFGLASQIKTSRAEADSIRKNYLTRFNKVAGYMQDIVETARTNGEVRTLLNRRRPIPEINAANGNIRQAAERTAINTPIQGTAADIIKIAMIKVQSALREAKIDAKMILQIHDEIVMETATKDLEIAQKILLESMESAYKLKVPLTAELKTAGRSLE